MKRVLALVVSLIAAFVILSQGVTQEVPLGTVKGQILLGDSKMPLKDGLITLRPFGTYAGSDETQQVKFAETDERGNFEVRNVPVGAYDVEVAASYHDLPRTIISVSEGTPQQLDLRMARLGDQLTVYNSQRVMTPGESPELEVHGFFTASSLNVEVRKLNVELIAESGGIDRVAYPISSAGVSHPILKASPVIRQFEQKVTNKDAEGAFVTRLQMKPLPEGLYWVTVKGAKLVQNAFLNVTRLSLVTKSVDDQVLCFATDLKTGKPVAGVRVRAADGKELKFLGTTAADGTLVGELGKSRTNNQRAVIAQKGASVALVGFYTRSQDRSPVRIVGYTERPVYRPGDTIRFKGIARKVVDTVMSPPRAGTVKVEFHDAQGEVVETQNLSVSAHGTFSGEFTTSSAADPGYYTIQVAGYDTRAMVGVELVAYRKPEYKVKITPNGGPFVLGQPASVVVECEYYFGGPVVGATVKAGVYRSRVWSNSDDEEGYDSSYDTAGTGEYSQELEATTDTAGRAILTFPTRADGDPDRYDYDYAFNIYASVADAGGKYFDGEGSVIVHRGKVDVQVSTGQWFAKPGSTVKVTAAVHDAIAATKPIAGQEVTLEISEWRWTKNTSVTVPRQTLQGRTDASGDAVFDVPFPKGGDFQIRATTKDQDGRPVTSTTSLYVSGGEPAEIQPSLKVQLDQKSYRPGDTAKVLIQTDRPGGSALVTVQADNILERHVVALEGRETQIEIPVRGEFTPNVFVAAAYVRNKEFSEDTRRLTVDNDVRKLKVQVKSMRDTYLPGEKAQVQVTTTDLQGNPTAAEVSLAVVDESIYAIREDNTDIRAMLDPRRYDRIQTNFSFPEVYLDGGDKGSADVPLRKRFEDTAAWQPAVWTGASGSATVTVDLPDNLTQWRITAIGLTDAGASGQATYKFRARKPLMVRIAPPSFMVEGDRNEVAVSVTNDTGADRDVKVDVSATGIQLDGERTPTIHVTAGETKAVKLNLVAQEAGEAVLAARAFVDAQTNDGVESRFEIKAHGRLVTSAGSGRALPEGTMEFARAANANLRTGGLTVSLSPSLAGGLVQSLDKLVDYPYGCVEQTMSRFMPAVVVADAIERLGLSKPALMQRIPRVASDSMMRLRSMQHGDGAWGWWEYDQSDPFMTALVLDGLDRSTRAGYPAKGINLKGAITWSKNRLAHPQKEDSLRVRLYLAYALLRHGQKDIKVPAFDLAKASGVELATAILACREAGQTEAMKAAVSRLEAIADVGPSQARWAPSDNAWGEEPNALALVALSVADPENPLIDKVVRGMMANRRGGGWTSTRDTAYSIIGLVSVLNRSSATPAATSANVSIGGKVVQQVAIDPSSSEGVTVTIPIDKLPSGAFAVTVTANSGQLYYTGELRQFVQDEELQAASNDPELAVTRVYRRMEPRRVEDGTTRLMPSEKPVTEAKAGDLIQVEITLSAKSARRYVMVEDPIPSSCRISDRADIADGEEWGWWWSRTVIRDDRIAFFAQEIPKGEHKLTYMMRVESPGLTSGLPTHVERMYEPERWASPAENRLKVNP